MPTPDFDQLFEQAYDRETGVPGAREHLNALWKALFELKEWLFLVSPTSLKQGNPHPYCSQFGDENYWAFVFTDSQRLERFAREQGLIGENEDAHVIAMAPDDARDWLRRVQEQGLHGVRFNQGPNGWFAPIDNIERIHDLLLGQDGEGFA